MCLSCRFIYMHNPQNCRTGFDPTRTESNHLSLSISELFVCLCSPSSEYYFSEANLSRDAYLRSQMGANGWVPVDTLLRFRRLSQLRASPELVVKVCACAHLLCTRYVRM